MKRKIFILVLAVIFATFVGCDSRQKVKIGKIGSTDLAIVQINNQPITEMHKGEKKETQIRLDENHILTIINSKESNYFINVSTKAQLIEQLGFDYHEYWYDYAQSLKAISYRDSEHNIAAAFAFSTHDNELIFVSLQNEK